MSGYEISKNGFPTEYGLYDPQNEHENCGFGFIANINNPTNAITIPLVNPNKKFTIECCNISIHDTSFASKRFLFLCINLFI